MDIKTYLKEKRELVDSFLRSHFDAPFAPSLLNNAMTYSLFAGGKRIRPILALASHEACGGVAEDIVPCAASLEFIHTYSLIHDDLPSMDNDDLRRGKPTSHKVFGEGMAILAGDALLTEAFYLISEWGFRDREFRAKRNGKGRTRSSTPAAPSVALRVVREISLAAGAHGMVGGQAEDVLSEDTALDGDNLSFIHAHKTGALITASVRMGAILAGAEEKSIHALTRYGESIGLAFQIIDDVLDVIGDSGEMGKPSGSDEKKKKITYPGLYGTERSVRIAEEFVRNAVSALASFSESAEPLRAMAHYIAERRN